MMAIMFLKNVMLKISRCFQFEYIYYRMSLEMYTNFIMTHTETFLHRSKSIRFIGFNQITFSI